MRKLFIILLFSQSANATNYFVKNGGSDAANGLTDATAWATPSKAFLTAISGDSIFFAKGDTWGVSSKLVPQANNIYFGAYGTGVKPIITGFQSATMASVGGNIYTSTLASSPKTLNAVLINGLLRAKARYPNNNYLSLVSAPSTTQLIVPHSSGSTVGYGIAVRAARWVIDVAKIDSVKVGATNDTLRVSPALTYNTLATSFFFQNNALLLDTVNEWSFDSTTNLLSVYATSLPSVEVSTIDTLIYLANRSNITIDGLKLTGSNKAAIELFTTSDITIKNSTIDNNGANGITETFAASGSVLRTYILNDTITNCLSNGIYTDPDVSDSIIGNYVSKIGIYQGMGKNGSNSYTAIYNHGLAGSIANATIINNTIDSVGYNGIRFRGRHSIIKYNFITNHSLVKDDGGGIYTFVGNGDQKLDSGSRVTKNIVVNGPGAAASPSDNFRYGHGIYLDDGASYITVDSNTVYNSTSSDIFTKGAYNNFFGNTIYSTGTSAGLYSDRYFLGTSFNWTIQSNLFYRPSAGLMLAFGGLTDTTETINNNIYLSAAGGNLFGRASTGYTLPEWQAETSNDLNSITSFPSGITAAEPLFKYNATTSLVVETLTGTYINARGQSYTGAVTIQPFMSELLYKAVTDILPNKRLKKIKIRGIIK